MNMNELNALTASVVGSLVTDRQAEADARDAISGEGIDSIIRSLFPGVDATLLTSNRDITNLLQSGVGRYMRAMTRGTLNWEWDGDGEPPEVGAPLWVERQGKDLIQDGASDALVTGKFGFFPYRRPDGQVRVTALAGYLRPIYSAGELTDPEALLQVTRQRKGDKWLWQVRRYSPGLLDVWSDVEDLGKFLGTAPQQFPQKHAPDRLPVSFRVVNRNTNRAPEGLAQTALPSFRRYVRFAVLVAFIATKGGLEERVAKSDELFRLAKEDPNHPLLKELKRVSTNRMVMMDAAGDYTRLPPVTLQDYREQEKLAGSDVRDILNMPDVDGADLSGDALAEKREAYSETVTGLSNAQAEALTEVHGLLAALEPGQYRPGWRVTHQPRFAKDVAGERQALREDYKVGLPKSAWLSGLQSLGVSQVTEAHIKAAQLLEELELPEGVGTGG